MWMDHEVSTNFLFEIDIWILELAGFQDRRY